MCQDSGTIKNFVLLKICQDLDAIYNFVSFASDSSNRVDTVIFRSKRDQNQNNLLKHFCN